MSLNQLISQRDKISLAVFCDENRFIIGVAKLRYNKIITIFFYAVKAQEGVFSFSLLFAFSPEAEPLFGVYSLLAGEEVHHICTDLCGATQKDILRALKDDNALYSKVDEKVPSFLGFTSFVRQSKLYYEEFFALASDLDTPLLRDTLKEHEDRIDAFREQVISYLDSNDGLECSQKLMGKTFHNRGPYEQFWFLPSLLLPGRCCRFFYDNGRKHNRQLLFCSIREPEKGREDTIAALKALSDETRYQILMFLAKNGPVNGQDIARKLKLAPSTVSHHMTELKERGLITEEPVRTAKYYGISRNVIQTLMKTVEHDLKL